jgi:hypothetical protein
MLLCLMSHVLYPNVSAYKCLSLTMSQSTNVSPISNSIVGSSFNYTTMFSFAKKLVDRFDGNNTSENSGDNSYFKNGLQLNNKGYALRVLNVKPHSTGHQQGFESWFDYIIRINGHELPMCHPTLSTYSYSVNDDGTFNYGGNITAEQAGLINYDLILQETVAHAKRDNSITFDVWNAKGGITRQISIPLDAIESDSTGTDSTGTDTTIPNLFKNTFATIGLTVQSQHLNSATYVWRILATHPGSPAFISQLVPYSDYIIGCDSAFPEDAQGKGLLVNGGEQLLSKVVLSYYNYHYDQSHDENIPITFYVYNHDYDILRPVTVNLTRSWGTGQNRGVLGCDVGYGLLHRIPEVAGKFSTSSIVDDVLFENNHQYGYEFPHSGAVSPQVQDKYTPQGSANTAPQGSYVPAAVPPAIPPIVAPAAPIPPIAPIAPRSSVVKKKKYVAGNALDGLSDYMNQELENSKKNDTQFNTTTSTNDLPPPPPKAS